MTFRLPLFVVCLLGACVAAPEPFPNTSNVAPAIVHSFTVDRAYTLTDSRELAFRDQIAAEAQQRCGFAGFSLFSSRPVGVEVVGEEFLYRQHEVQITCDNGA